MNLASLGSQKGFEPLRYKDAMSLQMGVENILFNKTNMEIFLIVCPLKNIE